jgi:CRP-like cAMP-binding protein
MVSPESLRRFPFFSTFTETEIGDIAMISEEVFYQAGDTVFDVEQPATALYLLVEGGVELWYVAIDRHEQDLRKEFYISDINPGEVFGISALIEPHVYTTTALVTGVTQLVKIDGAELRSLCQLDPKMEAAVMHRLAKTAMDRLHDTRVQLLAARA